MESDKMERLIRKTAIKTFGYTPIQLEAVDIILEILNKKYGSLIRIMPMDVIQPLEDRNMVLTVYDFRYVLDKLVADKVIEIPEDKKRTGKLLEKGREIIEGHGEYLEYIKSIVDKKYQKEKLDKDVKEKTLEHLERSIFKQKHSWLFFIANIIVTIGVAILTAYLVFNFGWK